MMTNLEITHSQPVKYVHLHQIHSDGTDTGSLCGNPGPALKCFPYQVKHAIHVGGICDMCMDFYTSHRDHFDNIDPPWDQYDEAMAFGHDFNHYV